jgi:two-component system, NarL family, invasion response regulator UvrY
VTAAADRVRVLVVDDSPEARAAIGEVVAHVDQFVLVASAASGDEALGLLQEHDPDLVLLDVRMKGLDGPETTRLIRAGGSRAAVVLVSALSAQELPREAHSCGADAIIPKRDVSPRLLTSLWPSLQPRTPTAGALAR